MASSRIEGITVKPEQLLEAKFQKGSRKAYRIEDETAAVLGNVRALERAIHMAANTPEITIGALKRIHRVLCTDTDLQDWGGLIRSDQNWIGGNGCNPLCAKYVPPASGEVEALLDDLCRYANRDDITPVVQAALSHAQFETIHPFVDGNGRVGRVLIHAILLRRHAVETVVPPISLALATQREDHYASLNAYQRALDAQAESEAINDWVSYFSGAITDARANAEKISGELSRMKEDWRKKLGSVRANSTLQLMPSNMQAMPYFTVETMVAAIGRSKQAVNQAVQRLLDAQVIPQTNQDKRSRMFDVPDVCKEFCDSTKTC